MGMVLAASAAVFVAGMPKDRPMLTADDFTQRYGTVAAVDGRGLEVRQPNAGRAIPRHSGGAGRRVWYR